MDLPLQFTTYNLQVKAGAGGNETETEASFAFPVGNRAHSQGVGVLNKMFLYGRNYS